MKLKNIQKNKIVKAEPTILYLLLCFAIPFIVMLTGYIIVGIWPFGNNNLLSMDLWSQYFPMIAEQYTTRREFAKALFSWNGALGFNSFAQSSYYLNSLFNFLLLLAPKKYLTDALNYLILFKFGLAGLSMGAYLRYHLKGTHFHCIVVSVAYALCAYNLAYINQVMWFDAVVFFPIIMLGFEKMLDEKKPALYCLMLAVTIYSSFYISFSICIFLVIYFFFYLAAHTSELSPKKAFSWALRFGVYSLLAGGMVAFVILPIYKAIGLTLASDIPAPTSIKFYNSFWEYIANLLPHTPTSLEYGVPNIYSGGIIFILLPLYFFDKKIPVKEKLLKGILVMLLFLSMDVNVLDYVWHGLHFPNQLPGRWTFIFSFVILTLCAEAFRDYKEFSVKAIFISAGISVCIIVLAKVFTDDVISKESLVLSFAFIAIYILSFCVVNSYKNDSFHKKLLLVLCVTISIELSFNTIFLIGNELYIGSNAKYHQFDNAMNVFGKKYAPSDDEFYRNEIYENWTFDSGQLFNMKGITYYSSTMSGNAFNFFKDIGERVYAKNVSTVYVPYSPITNALFSVKYIANRNMMGSTPGIEQIERLSGEIEVVENKYCLPVAFAANGKTEGFTFDENLSPLKKQEELWNLVSGSDAELFTEVSWDKETVKNATLNKGTNWNTQMFYSTKANTDMKFEKTVDKPGAYYICTGFKKGEMIVNVNDGKIVPAVERISFLSLGNLKVGDKISVSYKNNVSYSASYGMTLYTFDEAKFKEEFEALSKHGISVEKVKNGYISGKIKTDGGAVFTSVPQDGGFRVYCDGEEIESYVAADYLLGFDLTPGEHNIEIKYSVPGLSAGIAISSVFVLIFAILTFYGVVKKKARADKKSAFTGENL